MTIKNYFEDDDLALDAWKAKYQLNNETLEEFFDRIASEFTRLNNFKITDSKDLSEYGNERLKITDFKAHFLNLFKNFEYIIPGGSVLAGLGSKKPVSLSNCFVIEAGDSIGEIFDAAKDMAEIYKRRGGVGLDLSKIRPDGAFVNNAANTTGGVVPFMELYSQTTNTIGQEGRRGALMLSIDINHPDSPAFVTSKQDLTKITGANISVKLNAEFMKAAENNEDYILRWPCDLDKNKLMKAEDLNYNKLIEDLIYTNSDLSQEPIKVYFKKIRAKELWESIIHCAWTSAEPGILFWDNIIDNDPASVYPKFRAISTNPCGEIPLSAFDSCRLIATNLFNLVEDPFKSNSHIDFEKAYQVFYEAQIIGDILVDLELEAVNKIIEITSENEKDLWKKIYVAGQEGRRTGVGITGLGDMLAALGKNYNDYATIDRIMKLKMKAELNASIDLAIINGTFPAYNRELEYFSELNKEDNSNKIFGLNTFYEFLRLEFPDQFERMYKWGRRSISWSTIAPTGTISIMAGTSSGCEPVFSLFYVRRKKCNSGEAPDFIDQNGVGFKNYNVIHGSFKKWYKNYIDLDDATLENMSEEDLKELIKLSPWHNNTAEDILPEDRVKVQAILQKYTTHSISSTVNLANDILKENVSIIYNSAAKHDLKGITVYRDGSRTGVLVKSNESEKKVKVRPVELFCKVKQFKNERKEWVAFIGILDNEPYEIFTGPKDVDIFPIPSTLEDGTIIKVRQDDGTSRYDFRYIDSYGYTNTLGGLSRIFDKEYWNYARFVSALFRQGTPIDQVIKVVEGLSFTNRGMNSWKAGLIRSLKEYVPDGTLAHGEICDACGSHNIIYEGGCMVCRDCGTSHCG